MTCLCLPFWKESWKHVIASSSLIRMHCSVLCDRVEGGRLDQEEMEIVSCLLRPISWNKRDGENDMWKNAQY